MIYTQFEPHPQLAPYIDAYWTAKGDVQQPRTEVVLPDGCIDIIFNAGDDFTTDQQGTSMKHEKFYLVGTMTRHKETVMHNKINLLGIRFKPGAFPAFYQFDSLHQIANQTIEFDRRLAPDFAKMLHKPVSCLNQFFLDKLSKPKHFLLNIVADIQLYKGQVKVEALAKQHFITIRQLERSFRQWLGASPKEFINLVRYQHASQLLRQDRAGHSLLDIAIACGYYDHAHLSNDIKKYSGTTPGQH
jgi:AraC-like DNA-binding protein